MKNSDSNRDHESDKEQKSRCFHDVNDNHCLGKMATDVSRVNQDNNNVALATEKNMPLNKRDEFDGDCNHL